MLFKEIDMNQINVMLLVDYRKAFDMVDHSILLKKLECYGLDSAAVSWFNSYLSGRKQYVYYKGTSSTARDITDGVPQGSILGPLLFLIFINDLPLYTQSQTDLFADDTIVIASSDRDQIQELQNKVQREMANVDEWATLNNLPLNADKTKIMVVGGKRSTVATGIDINLNGSNISQVHISKRFLPSHLFSLPNWLRIVYIFPDLGSIDDRQ
ncbi:Hypothetical predicted protein [Paramuricea clavata]|uniref:Uncharacterized protein n=1 Tax=Paramuricea clavata TaxID=317549 RepID=A0A6S7J9U4_PARCT|nr:Hypothetical predicted protein [Paramuricea clavata]